MVKWLKERRKKKELEKREIQRIKEEEKKKEEIFLREMDELMNF